MPVWTASRPLPKGRGGTARVDSVPLHSEWNCTIKPRGARQNVAVVVARTLRDEGNLPEALRSFRASLAIAERLAKTDPENAAWRFSLSISHDRIGDVLGAQGNLPTALESYRASLAIRERLANADPTNAEWQRGVALSLQRIGFIGQGLGESDAARTVYERGREIMQRLVGLAPDNAALGRDLAWFEARLAELKQ